MSDITANVVVSMPSQLFTMARSFKAVANGKIYIGKIDTDPVNPENQIQVYVENEDGSHVPVSQPIIINAAGYPVYNGQIAKFVTVQGHSMAVYDAYGAQQFYFPNVLKYDPDQFSLWAKGNFEISEYSRIIDGDFASGYTITNRKQVLKYTDGLYYQWLGSLPKTVAPTENPNLNSQWLCVMDGSNFNDAIMCSRYIQSGVDCASVINKLQILSEYKRVPLDFRGIDVISFSGSVQIGDWFHWIGAGKSSTTIRPISLTKQDVENNGFGYYSWFIRKNPDKDLYFAMLQDICFDGQYQDGYEINNIAPQKIIRAFCWHFNNGAIGRNITALRCHFKNCPHEAWEGYTTNGGMIDGINYLYCSSEGTDPMLTAVGFNAFKCMNGSIDSPGAYGTYTIKNIFSFGNTAFGHRTLNDFKRGCENWVIDACQTFDMNDCHHSTDGSRRGVFLAGNIGIQTGKSKATKNFLEIQGENIDVLGGKYVAAATSVAGLAGIFVTNYSYPSESTDFQSQHIRIKNVYVERVNNNAVRIVNGYDINVEDITAVSCNGVGVSFEFVPGLISGIDNQEIKPRFNSVGKIITSSCSGEVFVANNQDVFITANSQNTGGGFRVGRSDAVHSTNPLPMRSIAGHILANQDRFFQSVISIAPEKTDATTKPVGTPYAFTLNDKNTASVQSLLVATLRVAQRSAVYVRLWTLSETSISSAVIFRELDSTGNSLSNTAIKLLSDNSWLERQAIYHVKRSECVAVEVFLAPACDERMDISLTGTTSFADVRVSNYPI
ncbi:phage head-binding domain-containing protein [Escherichia coli]|uniref:phage head-binding domain-containing protein n=1 Tax=Escherichia coli TaxID=562 RepID=UPI0025A007A0|nr:phage head-binding domain-containing protein [Escherichia coli]MDM6721323.1 phage head-binding domain-containing protein [Escherichia coli]